MHQQALVLVTVVLVPTLATAQEFKPGWFRAPTDRQTALDVEAEGNQRQVRFRGGIDPDILKVLQSEGSLLDGVPILDWLQAPSPSPSRKACLLNVLAKLRDAPAAKEPLLAEVQRIFFVGADRIYAVVSPRLLHRLQELATDWKRPFYYEGPPVSHTHRRLLDVLRAAGLEAKTTAYSLHSYRQEGGPCLQIVVAAPAAEGRYYADIDIDLANPLQDLVGLIVHFGEVASGVTTDHLALREKLAKGPEARYLCYDALRVR
jgi:hypothetical protein